MLKEQKSPFQERKLLLVPQKSVQSHAQHMHTAMQ